MDKVRGKEERKRCGLKERMRKKRETASFTEKESEREKGKKESQRQ